MMTKVENINGGEIKEAPVDKSDEPTREDIFKAYKQLDEKYAKLFRAYANLLDLYLGNMSQGEI